MLRNNLAQTSPPADRGGTRQPERIMPDLVQLGDDLRKIDRLLAAPAANPFP